MNKEGKYNEYDVVGTLKKKADIRFNGHEIHVLKEPHSKGDIGIKSKGKLDFLTRHCGYVLVWVKEFK